MDSDPGQASLVAQLLGQRLGHPLMVEQPAEFTQGEERVPQVQTYVDG